MRLHNSIVLIVVTMLTALLTFSGCGTKPAAEETTAAERACIELMQKVPVYYEDLMFWDVGALRGDSDLSEIYGFWKKREAGPLEKFFGINATDIDYMASTGLLRIAKGEFNLEKIRDKLPDYSYHDTSYEDMEVWMADGSSDPWQTWTGGIVLMEGLVVRGSNEYNVEDFIRVVRGEELSMYDKNAAEILERLPNGMIVLVWRTFYPDGLIVAGRSYEKESESRFKWTDVYKFESAEDAENAVNGYFKEMQEILRMIDEQMEQSGEPSWYDDFTLERSGEFVEWSVTGGQAIFELFYDA